MGGGKKKKTRGGGGGGGGGPAPPPPPPPPPTRRVGAAEPLQRQSISVRSGDAFFSAFARFVSATSSVLREVAMFIRMWFSPPLPYELPAFRCTLAWRTK